MKERRENIKYLIKLINISQKLDKKKKEKGER